jgi:hypothetical protein
MKCNMLTWSPQLNKKTLKTVFHEVLHPGFSSIFNWRITSLPLLPLLRSHNLHAYIHADSNAQNAKTCFSGEDKKYIFVKPMKFWIKWAYSKLSTCQIRCKESQWTISTTLKTTMALDSPGTFGVCFTLHSTDFVLTSSLLANWVQENCDSDCVHVYAAKRHAVERVLQSVAVQQVWRRAESLLVSLLLIVSLLGWAFCPFYWMFFRLRLVLIALFCSFVHFQCFPSCASW